MRAAVTVASRSASSAKDRLGMTDQAIEDAVAKLPKT
jgi:hypothetical protein